MLIPKETRNGMALVDSTPFTMQDTVQRGCGCGCGWSGDPYLQFRAIPAKHGNGWAVLYIEPGNPAVIIYRSDRQQPLDPFTIDHRIIAYLAEARRNWENPKATIAKVEAHDAQVEADLKRKDIEMRIELSRRVAPIIRKEGK